VEWVDAADEDRHLALLSIFPIRERRSQTGMTYLLGDREYPVQRGFLDATISVNEKYRLRCIGVHLKSKRDVTEGDQNLMRRNEAHLLRRYLDEALRAEPEVNLVVYGDFNDSSSEPPIRAVQGVRGSPGYLGAIQVKDDRGEAWTHHWSSADIYSRIDFLFYSRGVAPEIDHGHSFICSRDDWESGSDHRMIVAGIVPVDRRQ
jgi:endonuclease/exonuclease/phosphatase family metal-dependent hydrolase